MQPTETKTTFTPGPWGYFQSQFRPAGYVVDSPRGAVAYEVRREEDARLIAAATNMYAAIKAALPAIDDELARRERGDADYDFPLAPIAAALRAALARANGEG